MFFFFQAEDGIRDLVRSRGLGDVYKRQILGREEITINMEVVADRFRDKTIFVSGAAGSIGSEFCRQVAGLDVAVCCGCLLRPTRRQAEPARPARSARRGRRR